LSELRRVPGAENAKIRPRSEKISVIHSEERSERRDLVKCPCSIPFARFGDSDTPQKFLNGVSGDFCILGVGLSIRVAFLMNMKKLPLCDTIRAAREKPGLKVVGKENDIVPQIAQSS